MDQITKIDLPDFDTAHLEIIKGACDDIGAEARMYKPYWWKIFKLGYPTIQIMTISLTMEINKGWHRNLTISDVYNKIIQHFK